MSGNTSNTLDILVNSTEENIYINTEENEKLG